MKTSHRLLWLFGKPSRTAWGLAAALLPGHASVLTFDDWSFVGNRPYLDDGQVAGVTFDFKEGGVDSLDAYYGYNDVPPNGWARIQGLFGEGSAAGVLSLDFDLPTATLSFDFALNLEEHVTSAVKVSLFDVALMPLGDHFADATVLAVFAEGSFAYRGTPVKRVVLGFNDDEASRFALDNVVYGVEVPEPAAATVVGLALAAWATLWARRSKTCTSRDSARPT